MPEANLIDVAHEATPYEDVVCVGLFQPAGRGVGKARQAPAWSLVVVTESKVHILGVKPVVPYVTVSDPRLFATLDRATTVVRATTDTLVLADAVSGREYLLQYSAGHGERVIKELDALPAEP